MNAPSGKYEFEELRRKVWSAMTKMQGHAKGQREAVKLQAVIAIAVNELMSAVVDSKRIEDTSSDPM